MYEVYESKYSMNPNFYQRQKENGFRGLDISNINPYKDTKIECQVHVCKNKKYCLFDMDPKIY